MIAVARKRLGLEAKSASRESSGPFRPAPECPEGASLLAGRNFYARAQDQNGPHHFALACRSVGKTTGAQARSGTGGLRDAIPHAPGEASRRSRKAGGCQAPSEMTEGALGLRLGAPHHRRCMVQKHGKDPQNYRQSSQKNWDQTDWRTKQAPANDVLDEQAEQHLRSIAGE